MRILVTGGAGFIGSHIVDHYLAAGHEVVIVDNLWEHGGGREANINPKAHFYQADITDKARLEHIFDEVRPEIVNHHAAQASVAISTQDPLLDARVNVIGLLNVLTNCTRSGTKKIIFASSGATYGTPDQIPVNEETPQRPESPYGITKLVAEYYLRYWYEASGLRYTALRYGNVYGPRQDPNGEAGVIAIFANVAHANLLALDHGDNDTFCIATGKGTSVNEIYRALTKIIGYEVEIVCAPKRPGDIYLSYFDCGKAERLLGWKAQVSLEEGMRATVQFFGQ